MESATTHLKTATYNLCTAALAPIRHFCCLSFCLSTAWHYIWSTFLLKQSSSYLPLSIMANPLVLVRYVAAEASLTLTMSVAGKLKNMNRAPDEAVGKVLQRLTLQLQGGKKKPASKHDYCPVHGRNSGQGESGPTAPQPQSPPLVRLETPGGKLVPEDTPNKEAWRDGCILVLGAERLAVALNLPSVVSLDLTTIPMAGFEIVPLVALEFSDLDHCHWEWHRAPAQTTKSKGRSPSAVTISAEDTLVSEERTYAPTAGDVGCVLKLVCTPYTADGRLGTSRVVQTAVVGAGPTDWPFHERAALCKEALADCRVVTYNILADCYCDTDWARTNLYSHCDPQYLKSDYRKQLIVKEVRSYRASILCMQEVEQRCFDEQLQPQFRVDGLEGEFCPKATLSSTKNPVGCAVFYAAEQFTLVTADRIDLTDVWRQYPEVQQLVDEAPAIGRGMEKSTTVGQILVLSRKSAPEGPPIVVVNTHLFGHPRAPNIRVLQTYLLLKEAERLHGSEAGLIFTGDLNAQPADGVSTLALQGQITRDALDWRLGARWKPTETKEEREDEWFSPPEQDIPDENDQYPRLDLAHDFQLSSACHDVPVTYLTTTAEFVLDYVFYSQRHFRVQRSFPSFSIERLQRDGAIPSATFGSDHVSLIVDLECLQ